MVHLPWKLQAFRLVVHVCLFERERTWGVMESPPRRARDLVHPVWCSLLHCR